MGREELLKGIPSDFGVDSFVGDLEYLVPITVWKELRFFGAWINNDQIYNIIVTSYAFIIIFFIVIPFIIGEFGNWLAPLIIGVPDIAFPWVNNIRFWLLPSSLKLIVLRRILNSGLRTGWTV